VYTTGGYFLVDRFWNIYELLKQLRSQGLALKPTANPYAEQNDEIPGSSVTK
jgi:hypothetical protein